MSINPIYLSAIKRFEGFTPEAKWDYAQYSNGYGTVAQHPGEVITVAEADRRFRAEIGKSYEIVERFAPQLDEGTKAALTSLTYNAGTAWLKSGLGNAIRSGDLERAREIFVQYVKAGGDVLPGLVARREAEVDWIGGSAPLEKDGVTTAKPSSEATAHAADVNRKIAAIQQHLAPAAAQAAQPTTASPAEPGGFVNRDAAVEKLAIATLREAQIAMMAFDASERLRDAEDSKDKEATDHWIKKSA